MSESVLTKPESRHVSGSAEALTFSFPSTKEGPVEATGRRLDDFGCLVLVAICGGLLFWHLGEREFWGDELNTVIWSRKPVVALLERTDVYPPLYFVLMHYWTALTGQSEWAYRFFSALPSMATVWVLFRLGSELANRRVGLIASTLLTFSPYFVLFSRMGRYYALTCLLATLSIYTFVLLLRKPSWPRWVAYVGTSLALLYTHYLPASLILFENVWLLCQPGRYRPLQKRWLGAQLSLLIGFSPWLMKMIHQSGEYAHLNAAELTGGIQGVFVKSAYAFFSFSLGQTVAPWRWLITMPGLIVWGVVIAFGVKRAFEFGGERRLPWYALLCGWAVTLTVTATLARFEPASHVPCLLMFVAPMFYLLAADGLSRISLTHARQVTYGCVPVIGAFSLYGLLNYYQGREFHNPHYVLPWRQIEAYIEHNWQDGDAIVHTEGPFEHYKRRDLVSYDFDTGRDAVLQDHAFHRVWILIRDRGQRGLVNEMTRFENSLHPAYTLIDEVGFYHLSDEERRFKQLLLGRAVSSYNVVLRLYERQKPDAQVSHAT